jgi:entericidin A
MRRAAILKSLQPYPESSMKRLTAVLLLALFSMGVLSACNTMEGLGKDVKKLGEKVEDKASS